MIIFLDFDGVTHPLGKDDFSSISPLIQILNEYKNAKIVFSTQWREYSTLNILKNYFPKEIHEQIIGMTPIIGNHIPHHRFYEILAYNKENNIEKNQWIAIDDNSSLFPKYCKNLILINDGKGFNEVYASILKEHLDKMEMILSKKNSLKFNF